MFEKVRESVDADGEGLIKPPSERAEATKPLAAVDQLSDAEPVGGLRLPPRVAEAIAASEAARRAAEERKAARGRFGRGRRAQARSQRHAEREQARQAEEEARIQAEREAEQEARKVAEESARRQVEDEQRALRLAESQRMDEVRRKAAEAEVARIRAQVEAEEAARLEAEEQARLQAEEDARLRAEAEARRVAEAFVAEEALRRAAEEEAERQAAEAEAERQAAEAEAERQAAEEEAERQAAEAEAERQAAEEEAERQAAEAEAERQAAEEQALPEEPPGREEQAGAEEDDHARRWAEAEATIARAQAEQRERTEKALTLRGALRRASESSVGQDEGDTEARPVEEDSPMSENEGKKTRVEPAPSAEKKSRATNLDSLRSKLASVVWLLAVLAALVLAVSALCVALKLNLDNGIISAIRDFADRIDFGVFKKFPGSEVEESSAAIKFALVNQGIAAVIWLAIGKVLDKLIRP